MKFTVGIYHRGLTYFNLLLIVTKIHCKIHAGIRVAVVEDIDRESNHRLVVVLGRWAVWTQLKTSAACSARRASRLERVRLMTSITAWFTVCSFLRHHSSHR